MKIELDSIAESANRISAYDQGWISIGGRQYEQSLLISSTTIDVNWPPAKVSELKLEHFQEILTLAPEIVILGTGKSLIFPDATYLAPITDSGIGIEVMDTGAACRSYNFLLGEGRHVVAALLMIEAET